MKTDAAFTSVESDQIITRVLIGSTFETKKNSSAINLTNNYLLTNTQVKDGIIIINNSHSTNLLQLPSAKGLNGLVKSFENPRIGDSFTFFLVNKDENNLNLKVTSYDQDNSVIMYPDSADFIVPSKTNKMVLCRITSIDDSNESYEVFLL